MTSDGQNREETVELIRSLPPSRIKPRWVRSSGNQAPLESCLRFVETPTQIQPRAMLVEGCDGSGLSSLLLELERRLLSSGQRVISLLEGTGSDERYLLSNLTSVIRVPIQIKSPKKLSVITETVLQLRRIKVLIVHDFQRFIYLGKTEANANIEAITYLGRLLPECKIILGGSKDSLDYFRSVVADLNVDYVALQAMRFDQNFVRYVHEALDTLPDKNRVNVVDPKMLHVMTGGLIGETFIQLHSLVACQSCQSAFCKGSRND